jgi:hypothetical protein
MNLSSFFFFLVLGFELSFTLCKVGTVPHEPHLQSIFALVILEIGSRELFAWAGLGPLSSQISASHVAGITGMSHYAQL